MKVNLRGRGVFAWRPGPPATSSCSSPCATTTGTSSPSSCSRWRSGSARFRTPRGYVRRAIENPLAIVEKAVVATARTTATRLLKNTRSRERGFVSPGGRPRVESRAAVRARRDGRAAPERREAFARAGKRHARGETPEKRRKARFTKSAALRRYDRLARVAGTCATSRRAAAAADGGLLCYEALDERLDLEQYFRWTALMTLVGSGDHVDEAWFYASNENAATSFLTRRRRRRHGASPRRIEVARTRRGSAALLTSPTPPVPTTEAPTRVSRARFVPRASWDRRRRRRVPAVPRPAALRDPHGLLVCAEGDLDKVFARDPGRTPRTSTPSSGRCGRR